MTGREPVCLRHSVAFVTPMGLKRLVAVGSGALVG